jgi:hypothetical protein
LRGYAKVTVQKSSQACVHRLKHPRYTSDIRFRWDGNSNVVWQQALVVIGCAVDDGVVCKRKLMAINKVKQYKAHPRA